MEEIGGQHQDGLEKLAGVGFALGVMAAVSCFIMAFPVLYVEGVDAIPKLVPAMIAGAVAVGFFLVAARLLGRARRPRD